MYREAAGWWSWQDRVAGLRGERGETAPRSLTLFDLECRLHLAYVIPLLTR